MASTVESVDTLGKPPPHDRVNAAERSSSEPRDRQFKRDLKKRLKKQDNTEVESLEGDSVEIGQGLDDARQGCAGDREPAEAEESCGDDPEAREDEASPSGGIDITA